MKHWTASEVETVACDACGDLRTSRSWTRRDDSVVVRCAGCGLIFLNPRPRADLIGGLYGMDYFDGSLAESGEGGLTCRGGARLEVLPRAAVLVEEALGGFGSKRVLEVGCADGALLEALAARGAETRGLDLSPVAVEAARRRGLAVEEGTLEDLSAENDFDALVAQEVIEHVLSPSAFLEAAHRVLRPRGILLLTTPNVECGVRYPDRWMGFRTSFEHLYFFSLGSLSTLARRAGLELLAWETSGELGCGPDGLTRLQSMRNRAAWLCFAVRRLGLLETFRVIGARDTFRYYPWGVGHTLYTVYRRIS